MAEAVLPVDFIHPMQQDGPVGHMYSGGLIVVLVACALTCLISGWNIKRHCSNYNVRAEQRRILTILYFPPIGALSAFYAHLNLHPHENEILEVIGEVNAVLSFLFLLNAYLKTESASDPMLQKEESAELTPESTPKPANAGTKLIIRRTLGAYIAVRYLTLVFSFTSIFRVLDIGQSPSALAWWAFFECYYDLLQLLSTTTVLYWMWSLCVQAQHSGKLGARAPRMMRQFNALRFAVSGPMLLRYTVRVVAGSGILPANISEETFITACVECGAAIEFAAVSAWMMRAYSAAEYKEDGVRAALGEGTNTEMSISQKLSDGTSTSVREQYSELMATNKYETQ